VHLAIEFSSDLFFSLLLPPIIFSGGYIISKRQFFRNFRIISFYAVIGTLICFLISASASVLFHSWGLVQIPLLDLVMVISVLCATDAVAAVTLIKEKQFPVLNSVLAGEGIINDGIAIAIYRAILVLKD